LALLVDDAHWLDPDTLGLLALAADDCAREWSSVARVPTRHLRCRTRSMRWRRGTTR
jgi:hypothetical protein